MFPSSNIFLDIYYLAGNIQKYLSWDSNSGSGGLTKRPGRGDLTKRWELITIRDALQPGCLANIEKKKKYAGSESHSPHGYHTAADWSKAPEINCPARI